MHVFDIGCVADLCVDLILTGNVVPQFRQIEQLVDGYALELGGSGSIFASQVAKLGGRIKIVGAVGCDAFGDLIQDQLRAAGVDTRDVVPHTGIATGLGVALVKPDGDRAILTYLGTIDVLGPSPEGHPLPATLLTTCRHWHVASYFLLTKLRSSWPAWLARCRAAGLTTSLDTNWDPDNRWAGVLELLPLIDVFLPNAAEACAITGESDVALAGQRLASLGPLIVIKQGAEGALAFKAGRSWRMRPPTSNDAGPIVDSVGAGDNFDAGFLRGWLLGHDMQACLRLGHRCAAASLRRPGGVQGQLREPIN